MNIEHILEFKKLGVDCTEEESAELKGFLKEVAEWFPLEFGEVLEELS